MKTKQVILVVDDQTQNNDLLEAYLVPEGYEIIKATSGEEALAKLAGNQIDLILLDVMMRSGLRRIARRTIHAVFPLRRPDGPAGLRFADLDVDVVGPCGQLATDPR